MESVRTGRDLSLQIPFVNFTIHFAFNYRE